jgi:hypothetical protein
MRIPIMAVLRRGCSQSHVVRGGAQDARRMRDKTVGAGRRPPPAFRRAFRLLIAVIAALACSIAGWRLQALAEEGRARGRAHEDLHSN